MGSAGRSFQALLQNLVMQNFPQPAPRFELDLSGAHRAALLTLAC